MAELKLESARPLAGIARSADGISLSAPADLAIVAIALPLGGENAAMQAVAREYGTDLPPSGKAAQGGGATLIRTAPDQVFVVFEHSDPDAERIVAEKLGDAVYATDQTDSWCALEMEGERCREALERLCPLDLHTSAFAVHDAARTVMEHLGVLIMRTGEDRFLLLSASSSAGSFLHAVETAIESVG